MKIGEIISLLQQEQEKRGPDAEVVFHGWYGEMSSVFKIIDDKDVSKEERKWVNVWTDINSG